MFTSFVTLLVYTRYIKKHLRPMIKKFIAILFLISTQAIAQDDLLNLNYETLIQMRKYPMKYGITGFTNRFDHPKLDTALSRIVQERAEGIAKHGVMNHDGYAWVKYEAKKRGLDDYYNSSVHTEANGGYHDSDSSLAITCFINNDSHCTPHIAALMSNIYTHVAIGVAEKYIHTNEHRTKIYYICVVMYKKRL